MKLSLKSLLQVIKIPLLINSLFFTILPFVVYSQKYQGDISWDSPRISSYQEKGSFPEELLLIYRGKEGDYVIFYDLDGKEALFQFRRNRFDLEAEKKLTGLFEGQVYRVKGIFKGMLVYYNPLSKKNYFPPEFVQQKEVEPELIKEKNNKPVFWLKAFESTALDQVIH